MTLCTLVFNVFCQSIYFSPTNHKRLMPANERTPFLIGIAYTHIITVTSECVQCRLKITSLTIVYSTVYSGADQRIHQSSASLAFVRGIHRRPVNSPHKCPVTQKMFPFDDVIMLIPYPHRITSFVLVAPEPVRQPLMIRITWTHDLTINNYVVTTATQNITKP